MRATDSSSFIPAASIENPAASALPANEPAVQPEPIVAPKPSTSLDR